MSFDAINKKIMHHRSISQLMENMDYTTHIEMGITNPGVQTTDDDPSNGYDSGNASTTAQTNDDEEEDVYSGCFSTNLSPDSEYDEALAFPDSVTILSMGGENPILVERKDGDADSIHPHTDIPFPSVYQPPVKFKSIQRKVFIPGVEIHVQILDNERSITSHLLNPNLYTIQLTHGPYIWTIKKRYKHISALHQSLRVFRASLHIPFPTRTHKERRASFRNTYESTDQTDNAGETSGSNQALATTSSSEKQTAAKKKKRKGALPLFPNRPESLVPVESLPDRIQQLEKYLYNLLNIRLYRNHHETVNFLEVSQLSFVTGIGEKGKEGPIMKRSGSTRPGQSGCNCMGCFHSACCVRCNYFCTDVICGQWRTRWFFVKETFFGHLSPKDGSIRCVVLFDQGFDVSTGIYSTGMRNGLQIITNSREVVLKDWTRRKAKEWMTFIKGVANNQARDFTCPNPHMSFAPVRTSVLAGWLVDGASYMSAVADALEAATEEIYIADWWLSPEIHMKRPAIDGDYWRLDKILKRKAEQGVRVFVMLYKEVEVALGINSYYSKQKLVEAHENIKVFRHPDHARVGVFFWAHHEKIVAIDQTYAFIGGIDLCYGRWDDYKHRLTDLGSITTMHGSSSGTASLKWPVPRSSPITSTPNVRSVQLSIDVPDAKNIPYLEPGDRLLMGCQNVETEPCAENTKRNTPEMERKNMLGKIKDMKEKGMEFMARITTSDGDDRSVVDGKPQQQRPNGNEKNMLFSSEELKDGEKGDFVDPVPFQSAIMNNLDGQAKFWIGKDYVNFIIKDLTNLEAPYVDIVDRSMTPRMPWHDIGAVVAGASARDISRHFIQRWNAVKLEKARENLSYPYLIPKSYVEIKVSEKFLSVPLRRVTCQVLRSVSSWNCGFIEQDTVEQSIHDAYIQTITKAQHYVYIENQFFISLDLGVPSVKNQIADTLFKRIIRAFKEQKVFRVYVVMPLLPAFEGDVGGTTGNALRAITHWNYASMSRGKSSIISRLKAAGIHDPSEYISFNSLRQHDILNGTPVTELIYVHSKLLIADDKVVICGSANINDRSLIGKRDSEIAVIITDEVFEEGRMNGLPFPTGLYAGQLRRFLFKEHLGLIDPDAERIPINVADPTIDGFWNGVWLRTSQRNTRIYDNVFKCIPTDAVTSFAELKKYQDDPPMSKTDPSNATREVARIQGNLVDMPLQFLWKEVLTPPGTSKEGLIPTSVWT